MNEEQKPMEFWIYNGDYSDKPIDFDFSGNGASMSVCPIDQKNCVPKKGGLHVIEFSAYEKLQQEIEELKSKLLAFEGMTFSENEEISKLKQELEECKKADDSCISRTLHEARVGSLEKEIGMVNAFKCKTKKYNRSLAN